MRENIPFDLNKLKATGFKVGNIRWIVLAILCLILVFTCWFTVDPEEVGVVVRFGKFKRTVKPGLNFKMPFGIEIVYKVPVERQLKEEFGFRTEKAGARTNFSKRHFLDESLMLTGDLNAAEIEWITQYRINDPYKFLSMFVAFGSMPTAQFLLKLSQPSANNRMDCNKL